MLGNLQAKQIKTKVASRKTALLAFMELLIEAIKVRLVTATPLTRCSRTSSEYFDGAHGQS